MLAIETSTKACSVAVLHDGGVQSLCEVGNNIHSQVLLGMVQSLQSQIGLKPNDYDAVAVGQGPGSFTGLRIGVGVAQGIAYGVNCPMIGVPSLDVLANMAANLRPTADNEGRILAGIDARMGEIYWADYAVESSNVQRVGDMRVGPPSSISDVAVDADLNHVVLVGNAWGEYRHQFDERFISSAHCLESVLYPDATQLVKLARDNYAAGELISPMDFAPIYVRNDVAKKSSKPLPGKRVTGKTSAG